MYFENMNLINVFIKEILNDVSSVKKLVHFYTFYKSGMKQFLTKMSPI